MKLKFCLTSENAHVGKDEKLTITQIFDNIVASEFPAIHPQMSIVTKWEFEEKDNKNKSYTQILTIINNETNKEIIKPVTTQLSGSSTDVEFLQFIVNIQGLILDNPGIYTIKIKLGNKIEKIDLKVKVNK